MEKVTVSQNWLRFIEYCKDQVLYGEIAFRLVNGEPTVLLSVKRNIRFDKDGMIPKKIQQEEAI